MAENLSAWRFVMLWLLVVLALLLWRLPEMAALL